MARLRSAARAERAAAVALAVVLLVVGGALEAAAAAAPTSCTVAPGIRFPGNDLTKAAAATAADCCTLCTAQPNCTLWTWNSSPNGDGGSPTCFMKHGGGRASSDPNCTSGTKSGPLPPIPAPTPPPSPAVCRPVARPPPSKRGPPPLGRLPNFVTLLVDDLGFDDLRSHDVNAGESLTPNVEGLLKEAITLDRHHTYMWCSPTRRSFITGVLHLYSIDPFRSVVLRCAPLRFIALHCARLCFIMLYCAPLFSLVIRCAPMCSNMHNCVRSLEPPRTHAFPISHAPLPGVDDCATLPRSWGCTRPRSHASPCR